MTATDRSLATGTPQRLLEREDELAEAHALLADVRAGRGRMVLIEAPPGFGKSTLLDEVRGRAAEDGLLVLAAAGRDLEQRLGWGVAGSLFESWLLGLDGDQRADLLAGPAATASLLLGSPSQAADAHAFDMSFGILHGLYWLAVRMSETQPLLLVVDDAHWADEPSLQLLAYLLGRIGEHAIGVVVATRRGEPGAAGLVARLATEPAVTVRELVPLSPTAVATLVRERLPEAGEALCRRAWELTAGNPLGVREVLAALAQRTATAGDPDLTAVAERAARSLSRSVLRRLSVLSAEARRLADAVAVFEGGVALPLATRLAGLEPDAGLSAADELGRADILRVEDPLAFTHPLLGAAVYEALSPGEKARTHRRAAAVLAATHAPSEHIAAHLLAVVPAGDPEVVAMLSDAARAAMAHGVPRSAAQYLERALREPPNRAEQRPLLAELGRAEASFDPHRATEHLAAAMALADVPSDRASLALALGRALHDAGRPQDACAAFERGAAELGDDSSDLALELEAWYVTSAVLLPERSADAHRRMDAILDHAGAASTPVVRTLRSKWMIARVYEGQPHEPLIAVARELYDGGRLVDEAGLWSQAATHVAAALSYGDDYAAAEEVLARARAESQRRGWLTPLAAASQLRARLRLWTGSIPDVVADAETAVEIFSSGQQMYVPASAYCLARGLIESDRLDDAERALARVEADGPPDGIFAAWHHEARGRLAAAAGDWARALNEFLACGARTEALLLGNPAMFHWRSEAGLAALRLGDGERARTLIEAERRRAERFGAPRAIGVARRAGALLARGDAVEEELHAAAALFELCGARVEHALGLVELGGAIRRAGRPGEARETLREALQIAMSVGAVRIARLAREELGRAGGRAPTAGRGVEALTPSERRVAELAAEGRTNREIANELFVTVKAVEWHLGNCYRKLDIRGRSGLAAALDVSTDGPSAATARSSPGP